MAEAGTPAFDAGPKCRCGGPAIPAAAHHRAEVQKSGPALACARCGAAWWGSAADRERAARAHAAWEATGQEPRSVVEERLAG
jgi:hypothetical protein